MLSGERGPATSFGLKRPHNWCHLRHDEWVMRLGFGVVTVCALGLAACGDDSGGDPANDSTSTGPELNTTEVEEPTEGSFDSTGTGDPPSTEEGTTESMDTTTGDPGGCAAPGTFTVAPTSTDDPFGHLPFLLMFFNADTSDATGMEEVTVTVDDSTISMQVSARDMGSGSGHGGLPMVSGTLNDDCSFDIMGDVPYMSDSGDFGTIVAQWTGVAATDGITVAMSMSGGNIPSGPITFDLSLP